MQENGDEIKNIEKWRVQTEIATSKEGLRKETDEDEIEM